MDKVHSSHIVSTHAIVPRFAQGWVRDIRVRWALNEVGLGYEIEPEDFRSVQSAAFGERQPFHQMPVYSDGSVELFESGAIVLHIARQNAGLLPSDPAGEARAIMWMFAALNSVEPLSTQLVELDLFHKDKSWAVARRAELVESVGKRLTHLATWLGDKDYLEGEFTAGDLLMADVLRALAQTGLLDTHANLAAYLARCLARPAFQKAYNDQMTMYGNAA